MPLALLILLTFIYFIRPYEWVPGLVGLPLFQLVAVPCLVISFDAWSRQCEPQSLSRYPVSACVLALLPLVAISTVFNGVGVDFVWGFAKSVIIFFLIVGIVDTRPRLSIFLQGLALSLAAMAVLVILSARGIIAVGNFSEMVATGYTRLEAQGAYFDPNDTATLLALGILIALHYMTAARPLILRPVWLGLAVTQVYVVQLTDSRGGFLALVVGLGVYTWVRWGKKGLLWASCILPVIVATIATARMASIGSAFTNDTGQSRIQFWCTGLLLVKHNFLLGVGPGQAVVHVGKALHNTYIQAFAEIGFIGGTLLLGAFAYAFLTTYRLAWPRSVDFEPAADRDPSLPLVCAMITSYGVGILALNHAYGPHTYMVLGVATIAMKLHGAENLVPASTLFVRFAAVGAVFIVVSHITARLLVQY